VTAQSIFGTIPLETPAPTPVNEMPSGSRRTAFFMNTPFSCVVKNRSRNHRLGQFPAHIFKKEQSNEF